MAATDTSVAITPGTGAGIDAVQLTGGDYQQIIREARATTITTPTAWSITAVGSASVIAADVVRIKVLLVHNGTNRVWLRFDATIPTLAAHHWYLDPGDRFEVPIELTGLAVSMAGQGPGGTILAMLAGTA